MQFSQQYFRHGKVIIPPLKNLMNWQEIFHKCLHLVQSYSNCEFYLSAGQGRNNLEANGRVGRSSARLVGNSGFAEDS